MSWQMTREVRQARLAGRLPGINFTEFAVLLIMAETCRGESRIASIGVTELVKLSELDRSTMWRAITKLLALGYVVKFGRSNQYQAARYDVLPSARCADATCTEASARCADATCTEEVHVASERVHVASEEVHVAFEASARCTDATVPFSSLHNPDNNPERSPPPPGGGVEGARSSRSFAEKLVGQIWPRGLDPQTVGIALSIVTEYLKDSSLDEERADIVREALRLCPPEDPTRLSKFMGQVAARHYVAARQQAPHDIPQDTAASFITELYGRVTSKPRPVPSARAEPPNIIDAETVEDAAAGPLCDVCERPARINGKCYECWTVAHPAPPPPLVDPEQHRRNEIARLQAWEQQGDVS
jgi:hypothetical protein